MTCGAPAPLFSAVVASANPMTGPPGVSAPAIAAMTQTERASPRPEPRGDHFLRQDFGDEARADHAERDARQQREEFAPGKAQRVEEHRLAARCKRRARVRSRCAQRKTSTIRVMRHPLAGARNSAIEHAPRRPAMIGSGMREDDAPGDEIEPEERQLPNDRAGVAEQRPRDDECAGRAGVRAGRKECARDRVDRERAARQQRTRDRSRPGCR